MASLGARVRAPELVGRAAGSTPAAAALARGPARQDRDAGLLDVLLHQLPARPGRAARAGGEAPRRARDRRRALAEVRARGRARGRRRRRRAVRGAPPGARRPRAGHLEAVRRPGLADAGRHRPRGVRRRAARRRGARARARAPGRASWRPSTRPRARCAAATGRTCRRSRCRRTLRFPGKALRAARRAHLLVADTGHHQLVELAADGETRGAADRHGRARAASTAAAGDGAVQRAARGSACCRRGGGRGRLRRGRRRHREPRAARRATWPTATVTTRRRHRAGSGWQGAPTQRPGARAWISSSPWDVAWSHGRRVGRDGGHPPAVDVRPGEPATVERGAGTTQRGAASTGPPTRPGSRSRPGSPRRPGTGCGSPTPRPRRCAGSDADGDGRARPRSAPGCSTSATATARPSRRCCSTRSA